MKKGRPFVKRVVITGLGVISSIGIGKSIFYQNLIKGLSGVKRIESFDVSSFPSQIAAEVRDFKPEDYFEPKQSRRLDRFTQMALVATDMALKDANLTITEELSPNCGVYIGSGIGGLKTIEEQHKILLEKGPKSLNPFLIPMVITNMAAGNVAINFGLKGPSNCTVTACAASAHAIGEAYELIKRGDAKVMIAGGAEAIITPLALGGFCALRALSTTYNNEPEKASRPFDKRRNGFVMGEGAGILILEEQEFAISRGADIYAELVGFGSSTDAYHITAPDPEGEGAALCIRRALNKGGIKPEEVDYINAHGTSTPLNDEIETVAIKKVFGEHSYKLAISSTKSMIGHCLGAAGALELIATVLTIKGGIIHPTINYEFPDEKCDLDYVPNTARKKEVRVALSNSFGFGGHNATLVVKRYT